jgi:hypothetical protein
MQDERRGRWEARNERKIFIVERLKQRLTARQSAGGSQVTEKHGLGMWTASSSKPSPIWQAM